MVLARIADARSKLDTAPSLRRETLAHTSGKELDVAGAGDVRLRSLHAVHRSARGLTLRAAAVAAARSGVCSATIRVRERRLPRGRRPRLDLTPAPEAKWLAGAAIGGGTPHPLSSATHTIARPIQAHSPSQSRNPLAQFVEEPGQRQSERTREPGRCLDSEACFLIFQSPDVPL